MTGLRGVTNRALCEYRRHDLNVGYLFKVVTGEIKVHKLGPSRLTELRAAMVLYLYAKVFHQATTAAVVRPLEAVAEESALAPEIQGYLKAVAVVYYEVERPNIARDFVHDELGVKPESFTEMMTRGLLNQPPERHEFLLEALLFQLVEALRNRAKEP